ncbi:unnamed protein product [Prorocentrum cordatum]|uniref:EF-hand domain-containing protein n=1 Tax=Prorocentrum cordatum TaxID=2364126 RepID=A0ABN9SB87_9DINO|nr:unnamed protein product [Polarella glacialis]
MEMALRIYVLRHDFFVEERLWNWFDMAIVLLALAEVALEFVLRSLSSGSRHLLDNGGTAKILRLFRVARLLRLIRSFRSLKPLRMLVHSIFFAGKYVLWALIMLFMIVYAFGVVLTQAVAEHTGGGTHIDDDALVAYFGSLYRSMLSLWMAVSGGISWIELTGPLERTGNIFLVLLLLLYINFVYVFILNVVTGVFCQNALEGAQQDLDLTIESQLKDKQLYVDRLRLLFKEMGEETGAVDSGLTGAELHFQLAQPKVQSWFRALDIDATQTWKLFKVLDAGNSGRVSLEDFVEGCLRLRGQATRVDVESLKWEIRGANRRSEQDAQMLAELIQDLGDVRSSMVRVRSAGASVGRAATGDSA